MMEPCSGVWFHPLMPEGMSVCRQLSGTLLAAQVWVSPGVGFKGTHQSCRPA